MSFFNFYCLSLTNGNINNAIYINCTYLQLEFFCSLFYEYLINCVTMMEGVQFRRP